VILQFFIVVRNIQEQGNAQFTATAAAPRMTASRQQPSIDRTSGAQTTTTTITIDIMRDSKGTEQVLIHAFDEKTSMCLDNLTPSANKAIATSRIIARQWYLIFSELN